MADAIGAKNVVTLAMGLSSVCCLAMPLCADGLGVPGLWCAIAAMGASLLGTTKLNPTLSSLNEFKSKPAESKRIQKQTGRV